MDSLIHPTMIDQMGPLHSFVVKMGLANISNHFPIVTWSVNQFIVFVLKTLLLLMDQSLHNLFTLARDHVAGVRKLLCIVLVELLEIQLDFLQPHMRNAIEYVL